MVSYSLIQNKTDIQNFFGNSTYMSLMEHLKELHPKEVQAFVLEELHIYGNSRIGMLKLGMNIVEMDESGEEIVIGFEAVPPTEYFGRNLGQKRYELSNHLGNTLVTVTDKKVYVDGSSGIEFEPEITSISDYYPYGAPIASRAYSIVEYGYGFNGQELENEINGDGNVLSATFWEYDTRLARRWNIDPVDKEFESPYACFAGNPILMADPNGDDAAGAITGAVVGASVGVATGYLVTKNAPNSRDFTMIMMGTFGGALGALTGSYHDIGPSYTKLQTLASEQDILVTAIFTGVYNTMINFDKEKYRNGAVAGFFFVGALSGALSSLQPREGGEGAAGSRAIVVLTGGLNMINHNFIKSSGPAGNNDIKLLAQLFLNGMVAAHAGQSLHKKMVPGKKAKKGNELLKYSVTKGLEYGLVNMASAMANDKFKFNKIEGYILSFGFGFGSGFLQTSLLGKNTPTLVKLSGFYILSSLEYYFTSFNVTYNDPNLTTDEKREKALKSLNKKQSTIIFKTLIFNLVLPNSKMNVPKKP